VSTLAKKRIKHHPQDFNSVLVRMMKESALRTTASNKVVLMAQVLISNTYFLH
jgi:hypothetical protein